MRPNTEGQDTSTSSKCAGRRVGFVCLSAFLCIAGITLIPVLVTFVVLYKECPDCPSFITDDSNSIWIFTSVATVLLISGGCIIVTLVLRDRRLNSLNNSPFRGEVISTIPAENLEKSAAPVLSCNRVPHRPMSIDLPDYFTAVQNIDQVCSSVDAEVSSQNCPMTPPNYEEALEMTDFHELDDLSV